MKLQHIYAVKTFYLDTDEGTFFKEEGRDDWYGTAYYDIHSEDFRVSPELGKRLDQLLEEYREHIN